MTDKKTAVRGIVCTTVGGIFWGFSGTCGQYLFSRFGVSSLWLTCIRLLSSGVILTLLALPKHHAAMKALLRQRRDMLELVVYGVCGLLLCQFSYMTAISYSNAGTTTVLQTLSLIFIMLVTCLRTRHLPNRLEAVSLVLAFSGTYILATGGDPSHLAISPLGLFWGITTAAAVTVYSILPRRLLPKWGPEVVTGFGMLAGGIFVNLAGRSWQFSVHLPIQGWLAMAAIVLLGTVLSFSLFMRGVADIGPVKSSMLAATEPVSATVFSALWLHTSFSVSDLIGFIFILATIFLLAKESSN